MELDMKDFFAIYDTLLAGIDTEETVAAAISGGGWSAAETETAFGIAMTVVAVPLTFLVRWLLGKYGPSED